VACGWNHTIIIVNPNNVYVTGMGKHGQLGLGDLEKRMTFTFLDALAGKNV
jgi:alpha-tubulin suppressor-like RCC1 family protein